MKDKTDVLVADLRQLAVVLVAHVMALQVVRPGGGTIQATKNVHQGGFAGAGRAHDGHEFPGGELQAHPPQGMDLDLAHLVDLGDIIDDHHR